MGKVKEIIKRAYNDGIESLTPKEMVSYLIFRVKNLLSKNFLLSRFELEYLLCETGKGTIRFDPELMDSILRTELFKTTKDIIFLTLDNFIFFGSPICKGKNLHSIMKKKVKLINLIRHDLSSANIKESVAKILERTLEPEVNISKIEKLDNSIQLETTIKSQKFTLKYIFSDKWLYPYSSEIWSLYETSKKRNSFPLLVTHRIQNICYSLFKRIGMLGFKSFEIYVSKETRKECRSFAITSRFPVDFRPGILTDIQQGLKYRDGATEYFKNKVLDIIRKGQFEDYNKRRDHFQSKLSSEEFKIDSLSSFPRIFKLLSEDDLTGYLKQWYSNRKIIIEELSNV